MAAKKLDESFHEQCIRRMLRHRASKAYFKDGSWTHSAEEADSFSDVLQVAEACVRYDLSDVEVALRFKEANCDVFSTPIR